MVTVKLSITDVAQKNHPTGDIDERRKLTQVDPEIGVEIQQRIQSRCLQDIPGYKAEHKVALQIPYEDVLFHISGRIDGYWHDETGAVIDEIKSTSSLKKLKSELLADDEHPYLMQARLYAWIIRGADEFKGTIQVRMVSALDESEEIFPVSWDNQGMEQWLQKRVIYLHQLWNEVARWRERAQREAAKLKFPYPASREGQQSLLKDVENACRSGQKFMAQAPTGIGKTAAVLFPALKTAMLRGDKVIHVTPKNSQQREAENFVRKLHRRRRDVRMLTLTAKTKICMLNGEPKCRPDICPYAERHYDKVQEHDLISTLKQKKHINRTTLRDMAEAYTVCPWELARQAAPWMDLVIGDYHYALSPHGGVLEYAKLPFATEPQPILTIDEAHNLSERSLEWYGLSLNTISQEIVQAAPRSLQKHIKAINRWFLDHHHKAIPVVREFASESLVPLVQAWTKHMPRVLMTHFEQDPSATTDNPLIQHWYNWLLAAALLGSPHNLGSSLFFGIRSSPDTLTLHCSNAGPFLAERMAAYKSVIAFSATLKPFHYHAYLWGGTTDAHDVAAWQHREYASPFLPENRRIIAIPQVSTKYRHRQNSIPKIVEVIRRVTELRRGNYMAFFPSFELLEQTAVHLTAVVEQSPALSQLVMQPRRATPYWVTQTLKSLENQDERGLLILAVQGGVLSEGIDLPEEQLIGAFVVGPGLPMITTEREERRRIFAARGQDGFAMAYIHPAMAKSIQSAGRVIRTANDRGIIILMDDRFLESTYADAMPQDWLNNENPRSLTSTQIIEDLRHFWNQ